MKHLRSQSKRSLHLGGIMVLAALSILLVQCEAHHPITAQFVAQGWRAHSVTVLPISHPDLPSDVAMQQAERIAERLRYLHPDVTVTVGSMAMGEPVAEVVDYAKHNVMTGHFVHGHIWNSTPKRPYDEIEISERITRNGREVWSLSSKISDGNWESSVDEALGEILMRLPGS